MQADPLVLVVPKETFRAHSVVIRDLFMALVLSRYFQFPLVWVVFFFFFISHVTLSFPTSTPELFSMLLSSNEPSATTVSNSSFKMLPSNFIYHLFFIFRTHCYLKLIKKKKKEHNQENIKEKSPPIPTCKCHCNFFCFGNFTSRWRSLFFISVTECPERPGPIFAVSVNYLGHLNFDPRKHLRVWPSVSFGIYHVS